jgi:hypothetical protein
MNAAFCMFLSDVAWVRETLIGGSIPLRASEFFLLADSSNPQIYWEADRPRGDSARALCLTAQPDGG